MAYAGSGFMICNDCGKYQAYPNDGNCTGCGKKDRDSNEPRCSVCGDNGELPHGEETVPCEMCQFINGLPRPVVVRFADDMEQRLQENDHRGGWDGLSKQHLVNQLSRATTDLMKAMQANEGVQLITTRAADVANISMMIANNEQLDTWPKNGIVIQDIDTGLYVKFDPTAPIQGEDFPFTYVDKVPHSERYENLLHAQFVAFHYMEVGRRYRVIDFDNGGTQYVLSATEDGVTLRGWVPESEGVIGVAIPAYRGHQQE